MRFRTLLVTLVVAVPGWGCQVSTDMLASPPSGGRSAEAGQGGDRTTTAADAPSGTDKPWAADLLLGLPTGLRVQRDVIAGDGCALLAEGLVGLDAIFPTAGAGIRCRLPLMSGQWDRLAIGPGVDAYVLAAPHGGGRDVLGNGGTGSLWLIAGDVDLTWQHVLSERLDGECGVKLGAMAADRDNWLVLPVVSFFGGWRF